MTALIPYINDYFENTTFYGRDVYSKELYKYAVLLTEEYECALDWEDYYEDNERGQEPTCTNTNFDDISTYGITHDLLFDESSE